MQAQNSLTHRGAVTMVVGAAIFLIYAIVFFFRAFSSAGFELGVATLNGVIGLAWYGVRAGAWWAWITALISPVVGLIVALPMHYTGAFQHDWVSHLGPIYVGTLIFVVGAVMALVGFTRKAPATA
jgi:hypothetical protein